MEDRKQDRLAKTGEKPAQPKKKPYAPPRLVVYGDVEQLTSGPIKDPGPGDDGGFTALDVSAPA